MKTEDVKKLTPLDRFVYWIRERHQVYLKRRHGKPKPWTDDEVLQSYFFTNPYRENDRVTKHFRDTVREPLRDDPRVIFATVAWRWFNYPPTGDLLHRTSLLTDWRPDHALEMLGKIRGSGGQVFTGAFMINSPAGEPKLEAIIRRITNVWNAMPDILPYYSPGFEQNGGECPTMEAVHDTLTTFDGLGGFMAYEVVCDLRYTYLLENATDKDTWCNPGPGCIRGLHRFSGTEWEGKGNNSFSPPRPKDWQKRMITLLATVRARLRHMPAFEMREIEHSLCEWDKYERALHGDGKMKRTYRGT